MDITTGTQILAPSGLGALRKNSVYYFLRSDPRTELVLLVEFLLRQPRVSNNGKTQTPIPLVVLHRMQRSFFEEVLTSHDQSLIIAQHQSTLPPWLAHLEDKNINPRYYGRRSTRSHLDRINDRLTIISGAIENAEEILNSTDPDATLNKFALRCTPPQNTARFRLWFYTYLAFSRNPTALHYSTSGIGKWNRDAIKGRKRGAPSLQGKNHGYNVDASMRKTILCGYSEHIKLSSTLEEAYRKTMTVQFGCVPVSKSDEMLGLHQPEGRPVPSLVQFTYTIGKELNKLEMASDRIGPSRVRTELAPSVGMFSESVCNLLERVEADGYFLRDIPKGLIEGVALKKLVVVRMRCIASGSLIGIGFSLGGEKAEAYKMALFCAAIDKVDFCALFGITITASQWPGKGLPPYLIVDRGPASGLGAISNLEETMPAIRELTPTRSGQSKANIETTNPKTRRHSEQPTYYHSRHSPITLVRREIWRLILDNDTINISSRLTPDLINSVRKPSPIALWNELARRGRNDGIPIDFSTAVRSFLTPKQLTLKHNGVDLFGRRYDSPALRESGILRRVSSQNGVKLAGYILPACVRHNWIFVDDKLVKLDLHLPMRVREELHYIPLSHLEDWDREQKRRTKEFSDHRRAKKEQIEQQFEQESGSKWDSGTTKRGRSPRGSRTAQVELAESKQDFA